MNIRDNRRVNTLVIGWGNDLLGDDAAGRRVAQEIAARHLPGVGALSVHQLTPELSLRLADAETVILVDAYPAEQGEDIRVSPLEVPDAGPASSSAHTGSPDDLLRMASLLYDARPEAWLIAVPACVFEPGDELSQTARAGIRRAVRKVEELARRECVGRTSI